MEPQDERVLFGRTPQEADLHAALASAQEAQRLAETLVSVGRALTGTLDLAQVLDLVLEHLSKIVDYDRISVMLASGDEMEIVAARGFPTHAQPSRIPL